MRRSLIWSGLRLVLTTLPVLPLACSSEPAGTIDNSSGNSGTGGKGTPAGGSSGAAQAGGPPRAGSSGSAGSAVTAGSAGAVGSAGTATAGVNGTAGSGAGASGSAGASGGVGAAGGVGGSAGSTAGSDTAGSAGTVTDPCATVTCGEGQTCVDGACQCDVGLLCAGACVDTESDQSHCGMCNSPCASGGACVDGGCVTPMCTPDTQSRNGHITFYQLATPMVGCHWPTNTLPQHYGAMNEFDWNTAGVCGACVEITNTQNNQKLVVQIVDQCPYQGNQQWCFEGSHHIDLNQSAYSALGANNNPAVNWKYVACNPTGNIKYYFDENAMEFYLAVSPLNYKNPLAKVEVLKGGSYMPLTRSTWNMFELSSGAGTGEITFRLTDIYNHVITDKVMMRPGQTVDGSAQFAACP